jgi:hypothetical protein
MFQPDKRVPWGDADAQRGCEIVDVVGPLTAKIIRASAQAKMNELRLGSR